MTRTRPAGVPGSGEQRVCQTSRSISAADRLPEILKKQLRLPAWYYRESSTDILVRNRWERLALVMVMSAGTVVGLPGGVWCSRSTCVRRTKGMFCSSSLCRSPRDPDASPGVAELPGSPL